MKAVLLDADTLGEGIDFGVINDVVTELRLHASTSPEQLPEHIGDAEVVLTNKVVLNQEVLAASPNLKLICVLATGINNIDLAAAEELGIQVNNVEAYGTASVAQHTLMMMLALATRLPVYQHKVARGDWQSADMFCLINPAIMQLQGKKLVIVGSGELGQEVKRLAEAFGMQVEFTARPGTQTSAGSGDAASRKTLAELLPTADIISFHCPLTEDTRDLLNTDSFKRCKPELLVVNNARGGIVNEAAAVAALQAGQIGGLAADVLTAEPPKNGNPLLDAMPDATAQGLNLIVTPHNAWSSPEARQNIVDLTAKNIMNYSESI